MSSQTEDLELFDSSVLVEVSPFSVDFAATTSQVVNATRKDGGKFSKQEYSIVVKSARFTNRIRVSGISKALYQRMRILRLTGIKAFQVFKDPPVKDGGFPVTRVEAASE